MTRQDFRRGSSHFRRASASRSAGKAVLIVTEGEKTEPNYFHALKKRLKLTAIQIHHPEGTDPKTLTNAADDLRKKRRREAKHSDYLVPFDEVWVVYDLEKPNDERRKIHSSLRDRQQKLGIRVATSIPSFEVWLLFHFTYTTKAFHCCDKVVDELRAHIPNYSKEQDVSDDLLNELPKAVERAERCRQHHTDCQGDGDPSTEVDRLVRQLNSIASETLRFRL